jgi:hypothetical protein
MTVEREWRYRMPWRTVVWTTLFFGACALVLAHRAAHNDRGLILNGIIEMRAQRATLFYWVLTAMSGGFILLGFALAFHSATSRQYIVIRGDTLTLPVARYSKRQVTLPLREVERLRIVKMGRQRHIELWRAGKKYAIAAAMLPRKGDLDDILGLLAVHRPPDA